ncbi:glycosyl transferase, partial [Methylobacterium sp. WL122]
MADPLLLVLAILALAAALLPAVLAAMNLTLLRTPEPEAGEAGLVSILIPARNEAGHIAETVRA